MLSENVSDSIAPLFHQAFTYIMKYVLIFTNQMPIGHTWIILTSQKNYKQIQQLSLFFGSTFVLEFKYQIIIEINYKLSFVSCLVQHILSTK